MYQKQDTAHRKLNTTHHTDSRLQTIDHTLHTVLYTMNRAYFTLHIKINTMHNAHCTMHTLLTWPTPGEHKETQLTQPPQFTAGTNFDKGTRSQDKPLRGILLFMSEIWRMLSIDVMVYTLNNRNQICKFYLE